MMRIIDSNNTNPSLLLLLAAAEELIREKGCRATTLQDIINKTGLSKGAIYHYVSSKDELFGLILQSKVKAMNDSFQEAIARAMKSNDSNAPFLAVAQGLHESSKESSAYNSIFIYLLSQKENPAIAKILAQLQQYSRETTIQWIKSGQQEKAIPHSVDPAKMADLFLIFTYGLRVQNLIAPTSTAIDSAYLYHMIMTTLKQQ
ncbi:TetR/AcrR family transcriptional regulator [Paenibacillus radicis (ex Xue et al. 2023)]|uniref:TetR/AcrR family transcriptional regulator n=1 Tax=Paenibacillus radicis (ex Xue et al. 2023) TaxID=2972489 RepID=A0ABT1YDU0_9BACL|nr:TetR/AcrR family transcriptional regulator [Paenibacillus radicis (ex Xue et al. 2023)]MCR8630935.1 TetR/AcrR family transcriptional regulator [Paenibacillus radicis (ex Xue et al. 2023)]